jgi:hypothetical protein
MEILRGIGKGVRHQIVLSARGGLMSGAQGVKLEAAAEIARGGGTVS